MQRTADEILDELLVLRSQDGDRRAWRTLVQRRNPRLYAHARQLTRQPDVAADLTQETWLAMVRSIDRLDDPARFRAWAFRILANKVADWARRQRREHELLENERDTVRHEQRDDTEDQRRQRDRLRQLRTAIRRLPPEKQSLLTMFYVERMSHAEIAEALRIPEGTVKSRLFNLRAELKGQLKELSDE